MNRIYLAALYLLLLTLPAQRTQADPPPTVPLAQGTPAPFTGVLFSEAEVVRAIETTGEVRVLRTRNAALEANLTAVQQEWAAQLGRCRTDVTTARTETHAAQEATVRAAQRTWWEQYGVWVTLSGGLVVGAAVTTAVFLLIPNGAP